MEHASAETPTELIEMNELERLARARDERVFPQLQLRLDRAFGEGKVKLLRYFYKLRDNTFEMEFSTLDESGKPTGRIGRL